MTEYVPGMVYENLIKMLTYRKAALRGHGTGATLSASATALTRDEVAQRLNTTEHVVIQAQYIQNSGALCIVLLAPDSKYSNKSADLKKLVSGLKLGVVNKTTQQPTNLMFVASAYTPHTSKVIAKIGQDIPGLYVESYTYIPFLIEAPKHVLVPEHTIMSADDASKLYTKLMIVGSSFPKILTSDIQAVWIGARPGDLVKITRPSETSGLICAYRYCV